MWLLLCVVVLAIACASASRLRVELGAAWRTSSVLETACYLHEHAPRSVFWSFVQSENKTGFALDETALLELALQSGQYVPYVEAHSALGDALRHNLQLLNNNNNWAVCDGGETGGIVQIGVEREDEVCPSGDDSAKQRLERFPADFLLAPTSSNNTCIVHGDFHSSEFLALFKLVQQRFSESHEIRLRMYLPSPSSSLARLGGFSVTLDVKNTEYVQTSAAKEEESSLESGIDFAKLAKRFPDKADTITHVQRSLKQSRLRIKPWEIGDLSIQFALQVLATAAAAKSEQDKALHALDQVKLLSENLPTFLRNLTRLTVLDHVRNALSARLRAAQRKTESALYYNGQEVAASSATKLPVLFELLARERRAIELARRVASTRAELESWRRTSSGDWGENEERVDVRRFAKGGAVIFLNDLEKDAAYRGMEKSLKRAFAQQQQQQQLVQVGRNLYTSILVVDFTKESADWLGVIRHFVRMGAPIRFGLVPAGGSSSACQAKLFFAARKEYGMDAALAFAQAVAAAAASCEDATRIFIKTMMDATASWTSAKFAALAKRVSDGEHAEANESWERAQRYVRELNLPTPSLTFNGRVLDMSQSQMRVDMALQYALFAEQELIRQHLAELDEGQDLLTQILLLSRAKPKLSKFRTQQTYLEAVPNRTWKYQENGGDGVRITVWLREQQQSAPLPVEWADVRVALFEENVEGIPEHARAVVNGRVISSESPLTAEELSELIAVEHERLASVPPGKSADELLLCSLALAHTANANPAPSPSPSTDEFSIPNAAAQDAWHALRLVVNPLDINTAKLAAMARWMHNQLSNSVALRVELVPEEDVAQLPPAAFHRWSGSQAHVDFDTTLVPGDQVLTLKMEANANWIVFPHLDAARDPDNLVLDSFQSEGEYTAQYKVAHVLVDGHCFAEESGSPAAGMQLELVQASGLAAARRNVVVSDSLVMHNLGYWQMRATPGFYTVRAVTGAFPPRPIALNTFASAGPIELQSVVVSSSLAKPAAAAATDDDTMHVFSLASGALYERFLRIMMLSVRKRSTGKIKFWLLENYMSREMKSFLPAFAARNDFTYELVTFKWPEWLRGQSERQRQIWGMKILFLDVLFPLHLKRVIYVDADQVLRADLRELWTMDLHGAPYAMTPFCDSRKETLGFQFWRQGFWAQHLRGKPYHISALFVVDLQVFRAESVGDRLRAIYQQLSSDPNSLSNLDQDLPNFAQQQDIPIHSLPQEWLWCESWCSDESLKRAKTIDLCNNPLRKEPKLDMAKRVIRGALFKESWEELDREVGWN